MNWSSPAIRQLVRSALAEDAAHRDLTSHTLLPRKVRIKAKIVAKQRGIACALPLAGLFFRALDANARYRVRTPDGRSVEPGQTMAEVEATAYAVLAGERSALNAIQHLSGIATYTRVQVEALKSKKTFIFDTRKTLPGWRVLQKYAVACGGGRNHRMSLSESVLIKENHLQICRLLRIDWQRQLTKFRRQHPNVPIEIEIQSNQDLRDALAVAPDQVLLDNMKPAELRRLVRKIREALPQTEIEVSGGISTKQLPQLRPMGVDRISMGRLTHSAPAFDCSLDIIHVYNAN